MALTFIRKDTAPTYVALSTDIDGNDKIEGANIIGGTVFLTDTGKWKIIGSDLVLSDYVIAITTISGGPATTVDQGSGGNFAWKVDGSSVDQPITSTQLPVALDVPSGALPISGAVDMTPVEVVGTVGVTGALTNTEIRATPLPVSGPLTDTQLRNSPVPVSGTVTASGPLTDTQLRNSPVPVSGTVTASGPLTDTQLRNSPVPVSGTVTANGPLTDTQLRNSPVSVSGPLTDAQLRASLVPMTFGDSPAIDAFSRLRISAPKVIFQSSFQYDLQPLLFGQTVVTGGSIAHTPLLSSATLSVNGTNAASMSLQSFEYFKYTPGKSTLILMTQIFGSAVANVRKRAGYYDTLNGVFLEQNGTTDVAFVIRTNTSGSPVDNRVTQANWNLDKFNGTGPSGITLDFSKDMILVMDLQWLGMGRVRVGFDVGGTIIYAHQFLAANTLSVPYMQTGTLPIRWGITNTNASVGGNMIATCSSIITEGLDEAPTGYPFAHAMTSTVSVGATRTPILAIRPAATFNSIINRIPIDFVEYAVLAGNNDIMVELVYNPTLVVTGGWTSANANSSVEYHETIVSATGGITVDTLFIPSSNATKGSISEVSVTRLPLALDAAGLNPTSIVLCATALSSTSACRGRLDWVELR